MPLNAGHIKSTGSAPYNFLWEFGGAPDHLGLSRPAAAGQGAIELIAPLARQGACLCRLRGLRH